MGFFGTQVAPAELRGYKNPIEQMQFGDHLVITTESGSIYTLTRGKSGFSLISTNHQQKWARLLQLEEMTAPKAGERWYILGRGTTTVKSVS